MVYRIQRYGAPQGHEVLGWAADLEEARDVVRDHLGPDIERLWWQGGSEDLPSKETVAEAYHQFPTTHPEGYEFGGIEIVREDF